VRRGCVRRSWARLYARNSSVEFEREFPPIFRGHVIEKAGEDFSASSGFETAASPVSRTGRYPPDSVRQPFPPLRACRLPTLRWAGLLRVAQRRGGKPGDGLSATAPAPLPESPPARL